MRVRPLGQEDPLEQKMATHSRILDAQFHGQRSVVGSSPWGQQESDTTEHMCPLCFQAEEYPQITIPAFLSTSSLLLQGKLIDW